MARWRGQIKKGITKVTMSHKENINTAQKFIAKHPVVVKTFLSELHPLQTKNTCTIFQRPSI